MWVENRLKKCMSIGRVKFDRETSISVFGSHWLTTLKVCLAIFATEKKLNNEFPWNFVFPMELRLRNHWKCFRSVLGSLLYRDRKYLSVIKHSMRVVRSLKTCLMRVVHPPLLTTITSKKWRKFDQIWSDGKYNKL